MTQYSAVKELVVPKHLLFGLPWLLSATIFLHCSPWQYLIALVGFSALRSAGMVWNGIADRAFDVKNPRTASRPIPAGRVDVRAARILGFGLFVLFFALAACYGVALFSLALVLAALVGAYSYLKRFTVLCHVVLGCIYFLVPPLTELVFFGTISSASLLLGAAAGCSVTSNDILYSMQDRQFDRCEALHSIPARFGVRRAASIAAALHAATLFLLMAFGALAHYGTIYFCALAFLCGLYGILWKRKMVYGDSFRLLNIATGWILCAGIVGERLWAVMW